ncbi:MULTISPECIES: ALQxL family class IV lanthipeptide [Streptomyces]|uniref:Lantibiotic n=1 Tax=Streptomyces lycii TaxID=2654337 RepID=A0ABQ7F9G4_9ACTN|nr:MULTISPECIES: ALQxL family class IV lanthipeptide [Streptomyces]KAF4405491.1 hypothetical protein GCU69_30060 [Streptomyces lycii]
MTLSVDALQELESTEEAALGVLDCCWNSLTENCPIFGTSGLTTCHSCTNTNG